MKNIGMRSVAVALSLVGVCGAAPQMNRIDPMPMYSALGIDPYPPSSETRAKGSWMASFHATPYYQDATGARDAKGEKVSLGAEFGNWNLAGIFYGIPRATVDGSTYTYAATVLPDSTWSEAETLENLKYYPNYKRALESLDAKYTDTANASFDPTNLTKGFDTVTPEYKRLGVRAELNLAPFDGINVTLRGGACEYRVLPKVLTPATPSDTDVITKLQNENTRRLVLRDVGLSLEPVREVQLEDSYVRVMAGYPITFRDKENRDIAVLCPSLSGGAWIPTGKKVDQDKPFSIATGNDGHIGYFVEGAINIDFVETITISTGGGVTFFNDKTYDRFRIPSHRFQNGYYPWTSRVRRDPGYSMFGHVSMRALHFIDRTSCYIDYSYQAHESDKFTCEDTNSTRAAAFAEGLRILKERSMWSTWELHCGISYEVTPNLEMAGGFHAHADGVLAYRTNTVFGSMRFLF